MAQFRATIQGNRGVASRLGTKATGIDASINGWNAGIQIIGRHVEGEDIFEVWTSGGSNGSRTDCVGTLKNGQWFPEFDKVK